MNNTEQSITELSKALDEFYMNYPSTRLIRNDDCLVYKTEFGYCVQACKEANELISVLGLPLTASTNMSNGIFMDSFIVKSSKD